MAFSTPLICCSSGVITVSAIVLGEAPGYWPLTTTVGGTISGYSLMGRIGMASRPADRDQDGQHGGENRPLDEERGNVHRRSPLGRRLRHRRAWRAHASPSAASR